MGNKKGIISTPFDEDLIISSFPFIFEDSILLDRHFKVISIGSYVSDLLNMSQDNLLNKDIDILNADFGLKSRLQFLLEKDGFFSNTVIQLQNFANKKVDCLISGLYLGLISESSQLILLRVKKNNEIKELKTALDIREKDFQNFAYSSSHRLRGPLATILGLINISKFASDAIELKELIGRIEIFCKQLDQILYFIIHAESKNLDNSMIYSLRSIGSYLEGLVIKKSLQVYIMGFESEQILNKGIIIRDILVNLIRYVFEQSSGHKLSLMAISILEGNHLIVKAMPLFELENGQRINDISMLYKNEKSAYYKMAVQLINEINAKIEFKRDCIRLDLWL